MTNPQDSADRAALENRYLLPERERDLQFIADVIEYWLKYVGETHSEEGLSVTPDTHVMLDGENAPPCWPSVDVLTNWLKVLRDIPTTSAQTDLTQAESAGDAGDAIDFVCGQCAPEEALAFLEDWRSDRANEWPGYIKWLSLQYPGRVILSVREEGGE